MNKTKFKAWIIFLSLIILLLSVISGLTLPKVSYSFLGINHYTWQQFHYYAAMLFLLLTGICIALNWDYFKNLPKILKGK